MSMDLLTVSALAAFMMQAAPTSPPAGKPALTLSGCIVQDAETPGTYTFADSKTGAKYRLSSTPAPPTKKESLKRGEFILGHVTIRGALVPSPNAAAQQGALDPAKSAVASLPGGPSTGTGVVALPEFRATHIRSSKGNCP